MPNINSLGEIIKIAPAPCRGVMNIFLFPAALLNHEEKEQLRVEHEIGSLQKDMVRLSTLISEKRGQQEKLTQGNILSENDFVNALKVRSMCVLTTN